MSHSSTSRKGQVVTSDEADVIARLEIEMLDSIEQREREELKANFELLDAEYLSAEGIFTPVGDDAPDSPLVFQKVAQRIVFISLGFIVLGVACAAVSSVVTIIQDFLG